MFPQVRTQRPRHVSSTIRFPPPQTNASSRNPAQETAAGQLRDEYHRIARLYETYEETERTVRGLCQQPGKPSPANKDPARLRRLRKLRTLVEGLVSGPDPDSTVEEQREPMVSPEHVTVLTNSVKNMYVRWQKAALTRVRGIRAKIDASPERRHASTRRSQANARKECTADAAVAALGRAESQIMHNLSHPDEYVAVFASRKRSTQNDSSQKSEENRKQQQILGSAKALKENLRRMISMAAAHGAKRANLTEDEVMTRCRLNMRRKSMVLARRGPEELRKSGSVPGAISVARRNNNNRQSAHSLLFPAIDDSQSRSGEVSETAKRTVEWNMRTVAAAVARLGSETEARKRKSQCGARRYVVSEAEGSSWQSERRSFSTSACRDRYISVMIRNSLRYS